MHSQSTPPNDRSATSEVLLVRAPARVSAPNLREILKDAMDDGAARVVVDLHEDNYPDSLKIGVLIRFKNRAVRRGGDLRLAGARGRTLEMLRITRLDTVFELFDDVDAARASFG